MVWKKEAPAGDGGREFSERYYQEQIACLSERNRELMKEFEESVETTEKWIRLYEESEKTREAYKKDAERSGRLLKIALWAWTAIWITDIVVRLCSR